MFVFQYWDTIISLRYYVITLVRALELEPWLELMIMNHQFFLRYSKRRKGQNKFCMLALARQTLYAGIRYKHQYEYVSNRNIHGNKGHDSSDLNAEGS